MKIFALAALALALSAAAQAADLFDGNKLRPVKKGDSLAAGDTVGGYAIYPGDGKWVFEEGKSDVLIGPTAIWMGKVTLTHRQDKSLVAWQNFSANLNRSFDSPGWHGGPCTTERLVRKTIRSGSFESCLTIDPNMNNAGSRGTLYFGVGISNTASRGKYQQVYIALNAEVFGFRDTGPGDWTAAAIEGKPRRKEFIDRLTAWAETLQAAAGKAFDKNEAGDFYAGVPSYMTLLTVPDNLKGGDYSLSFIGAVEDMKDKGGFKAMAYSKTGPGETRWANAWDMASQDDANKLALDHCERDRAASRPPCQLYMAK